MSRASLQALLITFIVVSTIVVVVYLLMGRPAHALECRSEPQSGAYWSWRQIDGRRCWYQGHKVIPKSDLHWREAKPKEPPLPTKPMPAPPPRAEEKPGPSIVYPALSTLQYGVDASLLNATQIKQWPLILDVDAIQASAEDDTIVSDGDFNSIDAAAIDVPPFETRWKDVPVPMITGDKLTTWRRP